VSTDIHLWWKSVTWVASRNKATMKPEAGDGWSRVDIVAAKEVWSMNVNSAPLSSYLG